MPKSYGFRALELMWWQSSALVIELTERDEVTMSCVVLVLETDGYVRKPLDNREPLSRMKAELRCVG